MQIPIKYYLQINSSSSTFNFYRYQLIIILSLLQGKFLNFRILFIPTSFPRPYTSRKREHNITATTTHYITIIIIISRATFLPSRELQHGGMALCSIHIQINIFSPRFFFVWARCALPSSTASVQPSPARPVNKAIRAANEPPQSKQQQQQ